MHPGCAGTGVEVAEPTSAARPGHARMYKVLLHDDDLTPMDFVCDVLRQVFAKDSSEARRTMYEAHRTGVALVEVVPFERAELHVDQAHSLARTRRYPLSLSIESAG